MKQHQVILPASLVSWRWGLDSEGGNKFFELNKILLLFIFVVTIFQRNSEVWSISNCLSSRLYLCNTILRLPERCILMSFQSIRPAYLLLITFVSFCSFLRYIWSFGGIPNSLPLLFFFDFLKSPNKLMHYLITSVGMHNIHSTFLPLLPSMQLPNKVQTSSAFTATGFQGFLSELVIG